jgi:hypothetical protein
MVEGRAHLGPTRSQQRLGCIFPEEVTGAETHQEFSRS